MNANMSDYGLWSLVLINSVVFILFAYSFFKPRPTPETPSCGFRVLRQNGSVHTSKNCSELFGPK
jgi:hypothetical protein